MTAILKTLWGVSDATSLLILEGHTVTDDSGHDATLASGGVEF